MAKENEKKENKKIYLLIIAILAVIIAILSVLLIKANINNSKNDKYLNEYYYDKDGLQIYLKLDKDNKFKLADNEDGMYNGDFVLLNDKLVLLSDDIGSLLFYIKDENVLCMHEKECENGYKFNKIDPSNRPNLNIDLIKKTTFENEEEYQSVLNSGNKQTFKEIIDEAIKAFKNEAAYKDKINTLKKADLSNYVDDDKKINVYLFRGNTCPHCLDAIVFFAENVKDYGQYFNLVSYEVWNDETNNKIMNDVAKRKFNENISGVPYIIVGDKTYSGFNEDMGKEILDKIVSLYNEKNK